MKKMWGGHHAWRIILCIIIILGIWTIVIFDHGHGILGRDSVNHCDYNSRKIVHQNNLRLYPDRPGPISPSAAHHAPSNVCFLSSYNMHVYAYYTRVYVFTVPFSFDFVTSAEYIYI